MDRDELARRLQVAVTTARDFAQQHVLETLPTETRVRIRLNADLDLRYIPDSITFPEDRGFARAEAFKDSSESAAVELLFRDGYVPHVVSTFVVGETGTTTTVMLACHPRFVADEARMKGEQTRPFDSVCRIPDGQWEERFSIFTSAECWTRGEFEYVARHGALVKRLALCGAEFDERIPRELAQFPNLTELELYYCLLEGWQVEELIRLRRLRSISVESDDFEAPDLPDWETWSHATPPEGWGFGGLQWSARPKRR